MRADESEGALRERAAADIAVRRVGRRRLLHAVIATEMGLARNYKICAFENFAQKHKNGGAACETARTGLADFVGFHVVGGRRERGAALRLGVDAAVGGRLAALFHHYLLDQVRPRSQCAELKV